MAHECPDCGELCYCDMEDCLNNFPDDIDNCTHYEFCKGGMLIDEQEASHD